MSRVALCVAIAACGYPQPQRASDAGADARADAPLDTSMRDAPPDAPPGPACSVALTCGAPASGKQTVCGQLYDLATNAPFAATAPSGGACNPSSTGPCSLQLAAYDAITYFQGSTTPLAVGSTYLDDCGRFKLQDITPPSGAFVAIVVDDRNAVGPAGTTNTVAIALPKATDTVANGVEHWIASQATTDAWGTGGGPTTANGSFVAIFRAHVATSTDLFANQAGVAVTKNGSVTVTTTYFDATQMTRTSIDTNATATGANGTGLLPSASVTDGLAYAGTGGISDPANCRWEPHAAAVMANLVFVQVFRKISTVGHTCTE